MTPEQPLANKVIVFETWQASSALYTLWQRTLGSSWPLSEAQLGAAIRTPVPGQRGAQFAIYDKQRLAGFACVQLGSVTTGHTVGFIPLVIVDPDFQRRGMGTALIDAALGWLRTHSAARAICGGKYPRLWPGIPDDLPGALAFFQATGWNPDKIDYDLGRTLHDYRTPQALDERMASEGVIVEPARESDTAAILAMQDREFASWADTYRCALGLGDWRDVLVARDPAKRDADGNSAIIGALLMYGPGSHPDRIDAVWGARLGQPIGGLGEVGVAASERKRGLGLALVARGSEVLRARGVAYAHIGYTSLVAFYSKLGYTPWQRYRIGIRALADHA